MSKTKLEDLLLQANSLTEETERRAEKNKMTIVENTMADAVRKYITEAAEDDLDSEDEFDETDVDAETGEELGDTSDEDTEETDMDSDDDFSDEEASDEESEEDDESPIDLDADMEDTEMGDEDMEDMDSEEDFGSDVDMGAENDVMDLTNASEEEVLQALKNLPDDAEIHIVKKSSFDVSTSGGQMGASMGADMDSGADFGGNMDAENEYPEEGFEEGEDEDGEMLKEIDSILGENTRIYEVVSKRKPFQTKALVQKKQMVQEKQKNLNESAIVSENKKLRMHLAKLSNENKVLKENEAKAITMLENMMKNTKALALVNSNLAYVSRLFTEHSTTRAEKEEILKKFDKVKTARESELTFSMLSESLAKRTPKKGFNVNVNESVELKKKVIKEERTFNVQQSFDASDYPDQEKILHLMSFEAK